MVTSRGLYQYADQFDAGSSNKLPISLDKRTLA